MHKLRFYASLLTVVYLVTIMVLATHVVFFVIVYHLSSARRLNTTDKINTPDSKLNFTELAEKYGYISDEHKFSTDDGYILIIFRIRRKECALKRPPVVLMHGLLMSADAFLDAGPDGGLAYLLADDCQDVWVGNCRGNYYSRAHKFLNPEDKEFWKFSVDEMGYYDVPATVKYVLDKTGQTKLNYVGFSQGAGSVFIMCSERHDYCDNINAFIGLAPATRHTNSKSAVFRILGGKFSKLHSALTTFGVHEVFSKGYRDFFTEFCKIDKEAMNICLSILWSLDAYHPNSITNSTLRRLVGHFPSGTSVQNMARYGQSILTENFQKFDYGVDNINVYKNANPPQYNLSASTMPVMVIYGENDGIVDPRDVEWLVSKLPNVVDVTIVPDPKWTHFDNMYGRHIAKSVFYKIQEYLNRYNF